MDKILSRTCPECDEPGHSSIDCPRLGTAKAATINTKDSMKLRISNSSGSDVVSRLGVDLPRKPAKVVLKSPRDEKSDSFLRGAGKFGSSDATTVLKREKRTCAISRRVGGFDNPRNEVFPRMEINAKRTRYPESDSGSEVDEPLVIKVDWDKPKKSKHVLRSAKASDVRIQVNPGPGDLRYQMKSKPLDPHLIPRYKTDEDLRFSIKRPTTESKRKKLRPPQYLSDYESEGEPKPPSPDYEPDEMEDEEALLKEVSGIKRTTTGSLIKFDSSGEENNDEVEEEAEEEEAEEEEAEEEEEIEEGGKDGDEEGEEDESGKEEEEDDEEVMPQGSEKSESVDENEENQDEDSSSESEGEESSSSSDSSSEEGDEDVKEKPAKPFIDIREKYESAPTRQKVEVKRAAPSSDDNEPEVKKPVQKKPRTSPRKQSREKEPPQKSKKSESKNREVEQKSKKSSKDEIASKSRPQKSSSSKGSVPKSRGESVTKEHSSRKPSSSSQKTRDTLPTRDELLKPTIQEEDNDSFSDDGENDRAHSGALATVEDTKSRVSPARKPAKIVPIFPFKTKCKPKQYPESTVPFIDSHCHIDYIFVREQNYGSFASYIENKDFPKNFSGCVANFCDPPAWGEYQMYEEILEEDGIWGAFGLHPHNARHWTPEVEKNLIRANSHPKCVAWGEMGLDYGKGYHEASPDLIELQKDAFLAQMKHALRMKKPFVIHARGAELDAFEMMKEKVPKDHRIHFHCYSGSWSTANKMLEHFTNMFLGVTGLVTFGTASDVREVARKVPLDRLLIETDAPYMKPSNAGAVDQDSPRSASPGMGLWVAAKIAEIRRLELDDLLVQVRQNVRNMYGI